MAAIAPAVSRSHRWPASWVWTGCHHSASRTGTASNGRAGLPDARAAGDRALGGPAVPLPGVRLLPPLAAPTVRDFVAFEEHVEGVAASVGAPAASAAVVPEWYQAPTFYFTNPYALIGAYDDVPVPPACELLDFELEVAVVVGRDGASLTPEQAREHIFGYTVLNDWSARDLQRREMNDGCLTSPRGRWSTATRWCRGWRSRTRARRCPATSAGRRPRRTARRR